MAVYIKHQSGWGSTYLDHPKNFGYYGPNLLLPNSNLPFKHMVLGKPLVVYVNSSSLDVMCDRL